MAQSGTVMRAGTRRQRTVKPEAQADSESEKNIKPRLRPRKLKAMDFYESDSEDDSDGDPPAIHKWLMDIPTKPEVKTYLTAGIYAGSKKVHRRKFKFVLPNQRFFKGWNEETDFKLPPNIYNSLYPCTSVCGWKTLRRNAWTREASPTFDRGKSFPSCVCVESCDEDCLNRASNIECDPTVCPFGTVDCGNRALQKQSELPAPYTDASIPYPGGKLLYKRGYEVFATGHKGYGLRAVREYEPHELICEYTGEVITTNEMTHRMATIYSHTSKYYCLSFVGGLVIDSGRKGSEARFVNHSCNPNCEMQKWYVKGVPRIGLYAGDNPIPAGTELTYDYNFDIFKGAIGQKCYCGEPNCRGVIGKRVDKQKLPFRLKISVKKPVEKVIERPKEKLFVRSLRPRRAIKMPKVATPTRAERAAMRAQAMESAFEKRKGVTTHSPATPMTPDSSVHSFDSENDHASSQTSTQEFDSDFDEDQSDSEMPVAVAAVKQKKPDSRGGSRNYRAAAHLRERNTGGSQQPSRQSSRQSNRRVSRREPDPPKNAVTRRRSSRLKGKVSYDADEPSSGEEGRNGDSPDKKVDEEYQKKRKTKRGSKPDNSTESLRALRHRRRTEEITDAEIEPPLKRRRRGRPAQNDELKVVETAIRGQYIDDELENTKLEDVLRNKTIHVPSNIPPPVQPLRNLQNNPISETQADPVLELNREKYTERNIASREEIKRALKETPSDASSPENAENNVGPSRSARSTSPARPASAVSKPHSSRQQPTFRAQPQPPQKTTPVGHMPHRVLFTPGRLRQEREQQHRELQQAQGRTPYVQQVLTSQDQTAHPPVHDLSKEALDQASKENLSDEKLTQSQEGVSHSPTHDSRGQNLVQPTLQPPAHPSEGSAMSPQTKVPQQVSPRAPIPPLNASQSFSQIPQHIPVQQSIPLSSQPQGPMHTLAPIPKHTPPALHPRESLMPHAVMPPGPTQYFNPFATPPQGPPVILMPGQTIPGTPFTGQQQVPYYLFQWPINGNQLPDAQLAQNYKIQMMKQQPQAHGPMPFPVCGIPSQHEIPQYLHALPYPLVQQPGQYAQPVMMNQNASSKVPQAQASVTTGQGSSQPHPCDPAKASNSERSENSNPINGAPTNRHKPEQNASSSLAQVA